MIKEYSKEEYLHFSKCAIAVEEIIRRLHDINLPSNITNCNENTSIEYLKATLESMMIEGISSTQLADDLNYAISAVDKNNKDSLGEFIRQFIDLHKIQKRSNIRKDFANSFRRIHTVGLMAKTLNYNLSEKDISELAKLHKNRKFRRKIENLLTECNCHTECNDFKTNTYDTYIISNNIL